MLTVILTVATLSFAQVFGLITDLYKVSKLYAGAHPTIETLGLAWDFHLNPTIRIKITPNRSLESWQESFIGDAHYSIARWKECIELFASRYGFSRLGKLSFEIYVAEVNASTTGIFDVTVGWVDQFPNRNVVAETLLVSEPLGKLDAATITLAVKGTVRGSLRSLNDAEMRTMVAEEFGHVLGLGHADSPHDLMAGFGTLVENDVCHTTLDIYALALVYAYLDYGEFRPPPKTRVSLSGTDIPYAHLEGGP